MFICFNGKMTPATEPVLTVANPSYKWGDGVFETMKVSNGKILLFEYHLERLFSSLDMLRFHPGSHFNETVLASDVSGLCEKNNCADLARVRLAVYRNEHYQPGYTIEAFPLSADYNAWNEEGWNLGLFPDARKQIDAFANLKSASHLPYALATNYAREEMLDEVLLLNTSANICEGSRCNIFLITGDEIRTPALHQGCINGVMRRHLITALKKADRVVRQEEILEKDLMQADEIFLTNALYGMRWVKRFRKKIYGSNKSEIIYRQHVSSLFK